MSDESLVSTTAFKLAAALAQEKERLLGEAISYYFDHVVQDARTNERREAILAASGSVVITPTSETFSIGGVDLLYFEPIQSDITITEGQVTVLYRQLYQVLYVK